MRKLFISAAVIIFLIVGCSRSEHVSLDREDVLILGTNATYPPYEFVDEYGEVVGFDVDVGREIAKRLGRRLEVKELAFDSLILSLKKGRIDMILSGMSITPARLSEIAMIPYQGEGLEELLLLYTDRLPQDPGNFESYSSVAVQTGTFQEEYVLSFKKANVRSFDSNAELVMEVRYGKSPVAVMEPSVGVVLVREFPDLNYCLIPLSEKNRVLGYGVGVAKHREALAEAVAVVISEMKEDGSLAILERKWGLSQDT